MSQDRSWSAQTFDYVIKPGIVPRLQELFGASFTTLAYFVATIFATVRLLPLNHACLDPAQIGHYGVRDVIAAAAYNLKIRRDNIDQIIVFFVILAGMAILATYAVALVLYVMTSPAFAQTLDIPTRLFATPNPSEDLVFRMMDHTFGVEGVFGSQVMQSGEAPHGFHHGLHALLGIYNSALLLFAIFIFLYHIVAVVYETTQSGTPFGQRFDKLWAPLRLVFALGILIPLASGLNAGQYMLLYIAKYGSGLASNSWLAYNNTLRDAGATNPLGSGGGDSAKTGNTSMYARPQIPDADRFIKHMMLVRTCMVAYRNASNSDINVAAYVINGDKARAIPSTGRVGSSSVGTIYNDMLKFADYGNLRIRFGHKNKEKYGDDYPGGVYPHCGDIILPTPGQNAEEAINPGAETISSAYFKHLVHYMTHKLENFEFAQHMAATTLPDIPCLNMSDDIADPASSGGPGDGTRPASATEEGDCGYPRHEYVNERISEINARLSAIVKSEDSDGLTPLGLALKNSDADQMPEKLRDYGWGGAGIWYNRIAAQNGPIFDAAQKQPYVMEMPYIMQEVRDANTRKHPDSDAIKSYDPDLGGNYEFDNEAVYSKQLGELFYNTQSFLHSEGANGSGTGRGDNVIFQATNFLFYTNGLFDVFDNRNTHPIAQMAGFGKTMINSAITQLYFATGLSIVEGVAGAAGNGGTFAGLTSGVAGAASGMYMTLAGVAAILGMMMFYVIPLMPFLYFFFAIGKWIRSIAEAMVGVPLWALAHISIEGEGFPTQASENGYYLLLEIFVRPFLVVAALIGALIIFTAEAVILNDVFALVTQVVGGVDYSSAATGDAADASDYADPNFMRPRLDQFFYTVMYVIILYMMANATFKLIDAVPQAILRWSGSSVQSFGDTAPDPLQNFQRNLAIGQMMISGQIGQAAGKDTLGGMLQSGGRGIGAGAGSAASGLASRFSPVAQTGVSRFGGSF